MKCLQFGSCDLSRSPRLSPLLDISSPAVLGATPTCSLWIPLQGLSGDVCFTFSEDVSNPAALSS